MKKQTIFLLLVFFAFSLSCQFLSPSRNGTVISSCANIVKAVRSIQPGGAPQALLETGVKQGGEFEVVKYFDVLTHLSMQDGYTLDYVYQVDSLGAYPVLYPLPDGYTPYASFADIPENTQLANHLDHLVVEDVEQGYFEFAAMHIMAGQFYLDWHANYNDTEIVCNSDEVNAILSDINDGSFGNPFDLPQQAKARAMTNLEPLVQLTENTAIVEVVLFTKWGGFYRQTYTISRSFPHTIIDVNSENLVPYDCGIMF